MRKIFGFILIAGLAGGLVAQATPPQQVIIRARIVELNTTTSNVLGFEWGYLRNVPDPTAVKAIVSHFPAYSVPYPSERWIGRSGTLLSTSYGEIQNWAGSQFHIDKIELAHGVLDMWLQALEEEGTGSIIARPDIRVKLGAQATIKATESVPYPQAKLSGTRIILNISTANTGTTLTVKPTKIYEAGDEEYIELDVNPELNVFKGYQTVAISDGQASVPILSTRSINTTIIAKDGETIVLGGLYREDKLAYEQRMPILGRIPVLGAPFRNTRKDTGQTYLLIFLQPEIVKPGTGYVIPDEFLQWDIFYGSSAAGLKKTSSWFKKEGERKEKTESEKGEGEEKKSEEDASKKASQNIMRAMEKALGK